ncbi:prepilin peptidase [Celerinatantimonas sp. YJH-8]|uniref:prepilin peptidase n=1 Tax=Celerinatantimonas sp. YJH-8 TaxID=3228714 RepID=UPI0038C9530D
MQQLTQFWLQFPVEFWVFAILIALIIGSFLNVLIYRLPLMLQRQWLSDSQQFLSEQEQSETPLPSGRFNLWLPGSQCPHCHHAIPPWLNIPVISWLLLKGRCHYCQHAIGWHYLLIELAAPLLVYFTFIQFGISYQWLLACIFVFSLFTLSMIDLKTMLLPDQLTLPLLWLGLLVNSHHLLVSLNDAVWGAALGYLFLWGLYWIFKLLTQKEGLGYGDFKLLAAIGAWLGWHALPLILLLGSMAGAIIGLMLLITKKSNRQTPIPFGPFLTLGTYLYLFAGQGLIHNYQLLLGY